MGLDFSNPIGLAAGFDRCGMLLDGAARSGLGSVELGSLVAESPDFDEAVVDAVSDNRDAHGRIADYFWSDAPGRPTLILALAKAFYELAAEVDVA